YAGAARYTPHDAQHWPEAGRGPGKTTATPEKNSIRWFSCHVSLWWCLIVPDLSRTGLTAFRTKGAADLLRAGVTLCGYHFVPGLLRFGLAPSRLRHADTSEYHGQRQRVIEVKIFTQHRHGQQGAPYWQKIDEQPSPVRAY